MSDGRVVGRLTAGPKGRAYPREAPPATPRPPRRFTRWTPADLARRRSLTVARGELLAAEARDDAMSVREAWRWLIEALEADEAARADPQWRGEDGETAEDELRRQSLDGDALSVALAEPGAWTSEDGDDEEDGADRMSAPVAWVAGRDQVAHAQPAGLTRTLCGRPIVEERWSWPATRSCADCQVRAGVLPLVARPAR